jgi:hypothetical protein
MTMALYVIELDSGFEVIGESDPVVIGDIQYPYNFPKSEIPGLIPVSDPPVTLAAPFSHWRLVKAGSQYIWAKPVADIPLADFVESICDAIDRYAASLFDLATSGVSPGEMASWSMKAMQASQYLATNNPAVAPLIALEAQFRGESCADIANRILANSAKLVPLEANIAGTAGKHKTAVRAATSFEEAAAYDWHTGWPDMSGFPPER